MGRKKQGTFGGMAIVKQDPSVSSGEKRDLQDLLERQLSVGSGFHARLFLTKTQ